MSRKEIRHQLALMEQDRIFIRNAHIRQKIWGVAMSLICIALWAYIMTGGCKYVLYGVVVVPIVLVGCWLILTKKNIVWQTIEEIRKEEGHYDGT
jgi:hypothetical protein